MLLPSLGLQTTHAGDLFFRDHIHVPLGTGSATVDCSGLSCSFAVQACRVGEAANPGPPHLVQIGTTNPSGLRGKEAHLLECGTGIFTLAETQLSSVTQPASKKALVAMGRQQQRHLRILYGAPASLRVGSNWAGSWSGVAQVSDYPAKPLSLAWPSGLWQTGRVLAAQHMVAQVSVLIASLYGYAPGSTHQDALKRTDSILEVFTKEVVLGRRGIRAVCGDFNHSEQALEQIAVCKSHGWQEAQTLASARWGQEEVMTCKFATKRDFVYLSPEAVAACVAVQVRQDYAEHSTVLATLSLDIMAEKVQRWPVPAEIPWSEIDVDAWHLEGSHSLGSGFVHRDSTAWMAHFADTFETSLHGFVKKPGGRLPTCCKGRSGRTQPTCAEAAPITLRPSRPGEESLRHDLLSRELNRWFAQLRRIQSLCHAVKAGRQHADAVIYRATLWHAIVASKGFQGGFRKWWSAREVRLQGSPAALPAGLPPSAVVHAIFLDFRENFRRFESWCVRKRSQVLQDKYQHSMDCLCRDLRAEPSSQVDTLQIHRSYAILDLSSDGSLVHLDPPLDTRGTSTWQAEGHHLRLEPVTPEVCQVFSDFVLSPEVEIVQTQTLAAISDIQSEFVSLWSSRWQKHGNMSRSDWGRVIEFAHAFLPKGRCVLQPITASQWRRQVQRFKPRAARGPDAWSKQDLQHMPDCMLQDSWV